MQTIGLIGGLSWESSAVYYQALNQGVQQRLGGLSSARTVLASVDLAEVTALQEQERWDEVAEILARGRAVGRGRGRRLPAAVRPRRSTGWPTRSPRPCRSRCSTSPT